MEQLPLVSICIPNYNNANFIGDAIQSCINQNYPNLEIIVIDNASTDNSWNIISTFKHRNLRIFQNDQNIGMYPNFMKAAEFANGDYIKFICADDWLESNYISRSLTFFCHKDVAIVTSKQTIYSENRKKVIGYRRVPKNISHIAIPSELYRYFLLHTNPIGNPTKVIMRKCVFDEFSGFDLNIKFCNDYELWMRISKKYHVAFINECLSYERKHENQHTSEYNISGDDIRYVSQAWNKNFPSLFKEDLEILLSKAIFSFFMTGYRLSKVNKNEPIMDKILKSFSDIGMTDDIKIKLFKIASYKYSLETIKKRIVAIRNSMLKN